MTTVAAVVVVLFWVALFMYALGYRHGRNESSTVVVTLHDEREQMFRELDEARKTWAA